jgi:hypothetical protein
VIAEYQDVVPPHPRASLATSPHRGEVNLWHEGAPRSTSPLWGEVDFERSEKSGEGDPTRGNDGEVGTKS